MTSITSSFSMKKKKTTQGRKKIEIKKIEEVNNRQVTFSKRRAGLFKKAAELCILTGAKIAIIVYSPGGRAFAFGHPTTDIIVDRYFSNNNNDNDIIAFSADETKNTEAVTRSPPPPMKEFNQHYVEVSKELEVEKKRKEMIQEEKKGRNSNGVMWYDESFEGMELDDLEQYLSSLEELKKKVLMRADELMMIKKTPALLPMNMFDIGLIDVNGNNHIQNVETNPTDSIVAVGFNYGPSDQV